MKLTEAIEGDDVEKFNQSLPMIVAKLRGLTDGVSTIDDVLAKNPTQGTSILKTALERPLDEYQKADVNM